MGETSTILSQQDGKQHEIIQVHLSDKVRFQSILIRLGFMLIGLP